MFHAIPPAVLSRMTYLEQADAHERAAGVPRAERLRQVPPEVGRFIALLAATAPPGLCVEIGTSAGYSALWLALACRATHRRVATYEVSPRKATLARETFRAARVEDAVEPVQGDALTHLPHLRDIAFCFLDAEKEIYGACYELIVPRLVAGGLLAADNALSHADILGPMLERGLADPRMDALVVPIGRGVLVGRKT